MKETTKRQMKSGFTLIELIIVIAILAFVAVVGIHNYGNVKEIQAKKVNLANIKRVYSALSTYEAVCKEQGESGYFGGFDSLIDAEAGGKWTGSPGTFSWGETYTTVNVVDDEGNQQYDGDGNPLTSTTEDSFSGRDSRTIHGGLGIYDGSWKVLGALYNAAGQGSGNVASLAEAQDKNLGTRNTGLYKQLGIYYLTASDATLLKNAGVDFYYLHNPSTAQAYGATRGGYCTGVSTVNGIDVSSDGLKIQGGGPGFRPDMSAFYPVYLTAGSPVAVIQPGSTVYDDLGFPLNYTNSQFQAATASSALSSVKLVVFGIGKNAACVRNQLGLGEAPFNPYYDKRNYRSYLAVFVLKAGGQGVVSACRLAGVLDCAGQTYRAAEYNSSWATTLGN
jgi:prepilin-type N-terminal cleavage/methylation domain-containing protein